jgi:L-ascorbate metabolism protein UlaG (beta-lactamase superfamily)
MNIRLILAIVAGALLLFLAFSFLMGWILSAPGYKGPKSIHFNGQTFVNNSGFGSNSFGDLLKWGLTRDAGEWNQIPESESLYGRVPAAPGSGFSVTFVNHATFLIQSTDKTILTDPIWSERASPFSFMGPARFRQPGIRFEDLPSIDLVLISHNHYDHLDKESLIRIHKSHDPEFIVPLGVDLYLKSLGIDKVTALDWWDKNSITDSLTIHAVPAQHFSSRGMFDRDKTLWSGFVIESGKQRLYFAGDTGYGEFFKDIAARFGGFDLAMIPIGAYKPRWFMSPVHVSPEEAVQAHIDVKSRLSIGMHFGTFSLADDGQFEPEEDLRKALSERDIADSVFVTLKEGSSISTDLGQNK